MKRALVATVFSLAVSWPSGANARLGDGCAAIKDPDDRAMCRALSSGDASHCSVIQDSDKRSYCRAVVLKNPSLCSPIKDESLRARCRVDASRKATC